MTSIARTRAPQVSLAGGTFAMGSDAHYPEESPVHRVRVSAFSIDAHEQFAAFVRDTGYATVAERPLDPADYPRAAPENLQPGSLVFTPTAGPVDLRHLSQWWTWTPGARWAAPEGPGTSVKRRPDHPVVHVAHEDAQAYAAWAGAALAEPEPITEVGARQGWTVVSMANDWATVFGEETLGQNKPSSER